MYVVHCSFRCSLETRLYIQAVLCAEGYGMSVSEHSPFSAVIVYLPVHQPLLKGLGASGPEGLEPIYYSILFYQPLLWLPYGHYVAPWAAVCARLCVQDVEQRALSCPSAYYYYYYYY